MKVSAGKLLRTSDFMEPMVEFGTWVTVDGDNGLESIPADLVDLDEVRLLQEEVFEAGGDISLDGTSLQDYVETSRAYDIEIDEGYSAYLSAPGYMDRTENAVFKTEQEAWDSLKEMYPEEFEGEE